jgi:hypothetical protein
MFAICETMDVEGRGRELHRPSIQYTYAPPWREMTSTELLQATRHQLPLSNFALASLSSVHSMTTYTRYHTSS